MPTPFTTVDGQTLQLDLAPAEAAFFARVRVAAADPTIDANGLIDLIYSAENPILARGPIEGRGMVTREILARPVYAAFLDMLYRKRIELVAQTEDGAEGEAFTVRTAEAAHALGISEVAVRNAMKAGRLPSKRVKGNLYTTPAGVQAYSVSARGPRSDQRVRRGEAGPVHLVWGNATGISMAVAIDGFGQVPGAEKEDRADGKTWRAELVDWSRMHVRTTLSTPDGKTVRYWEVVPETEPGAEEQRISLAPFGVTGPFRVVQKLAGKAASEAWKARSR